MKLFGRKAKAKTAEVDCTHLAGTLVLIVDDSPTETHILKTILEGKGFSVVTAENGELGVAAAIQFKPKLILMDVVMPGLNGFQATRKIKKNDETNNIPIIVVTTKDQETDIEWASRQGANGYMVKPVSAGELLQKIVDLLS